MGNVRQWIIGLTGIWLFIFMSAVAAAQESPTPTITLTTTLSATVEDESSETSTPTRTATPTNTSEPTTAPTSTSVPTATDIPTETPTPTPVEVPFVETQVALPDGSIVHFVKPEDTLLSIANAYGISYSLLLTRNPQIGDASLISVGQMILIRPPASSAEPTTTGQSVSLNIPIDKASSCQIDLENNEHDCDLVSSISVLHEPEDGEVLLELDLQTKDLQFDSIVVNVTFSDQPEGWAIHIGDSISNDGNGGDDGDQSNDAELQLVGNRISVFGNDYTPSEAGELDNLSRLLKSDQIPEDIEMLEFEIRDGYIKWLAEDLPEQEIESEYLFALNGQQDDEGEVNHKIYLAFNRIINSAVANRDGTGIGAVTITLSQIENNRDDSP